MFDKREFNSKLKVMKLNSENCVDFYDRMIYKSCGNLKLVSK
jgi:hypothetical protein